MFIVCEYSLFSNYFWKKYLPQCVFLMLCVIDEFGVCCLNAQCPPYIYKLYLQIVVTFGGGYGIFSGAVLLKKVHYRL